jgi:tetratricopeptide (TPR) repeat protein
MKKVTLIVALLVSIATFAQKDELKTLKKIYAKDTPSSSDLQEYKSTLKNLETLAVTEEDKVYTNFYSGMLPFLELANLGEKVTPKDQLKIFNPEALEKFTSSINTTLEFEKKSGKKIYTDDINETLSWFTPMVEQAAFQLNEAKQYKQAATAFYNLYKLDKTAGANLLNAAILSNQAEDFKTALKLYEEYNDSDYLKNGYVFYAFNELTGKEETFTSRSARKSKLDLKTHSKPRDVKVSGKDDIWASIAILRAKLGDIEGAKKAYEESKKLNPDNVNVLINEANLYSSVGDKTTFIMLINEIIKKDPTNASVHFNIGYSALVDDVKLVEEINKNLDKPKVYDELMTKRKAIYQSALPHFEESYRLDPSSENTKIMLKSTYEVLGMKDKAEKL